MAILLPIIRRHDDGEKLSVVGETIRLLADSDATGGVCAVFEETTPFGGGPPLHRHSREDEHFYVLEGEFKFVVDGKESRVGVGGYVFAPKGSVHTFVNATSPPGRGRMLVVCTPGGLENPFRGCDRMTRDGTASIEAVTAELAASGVEVLGPPLKP